MHSFRIVLRKSLETMRKLCLSTKFPRQELDPVTLFFAVYLKTFWQVIVSIFLTDFEMYVLTYFIF